MIDRLAVLLEAIKTKMDAALVTHSVNRRYLLGFPSSAGTIIVTRDKNYFIIDTRYFEAAEQTVKNCEIVLQDKLHEQIDEILKKHGVKTLGIESEYTSLAAFLKLKEKLPSFDILQNDILRRQIEKQRSIKSDEEIASIQAAQDIADKTFTHILDFVKVGVSEIEIAIELEQFSRKQGSECVAFEYIVAAGTNSSRPHAVPSENKVKTGDFVTLDFGATKNGYRSDMTRTIAVGSVSDKQREVYEIVLKAQLAALDAVRVGAVCCEVDKVARDIIDATAYKGLFGHGLGHSLGLDIHENPRFNKECKEILEVGVCMSVEPGIYIPAEFGVRIEDIVVTTENGCRNFCKSDKSLIIL